MSELRTVAAELANRSTRHELNQSVNNHVKPLVGNESDDEDGDDYEDNGDDYCYHHIISIYLMNE